MIPLILQQLAALLKIAAAAEAKRRHHRAGIWHTRAHLSKESHMGPPGREQGGRGRLYGIGFFEEVAVEHKQMSMTQKLSLCSCREFSHLFYLPSECVTHTSYLDASHHPLPWRLSWEMHIHIDITVPGFQMIKWVISVLGLDIPPVPNQIVVPLKGLMTQPPQTALDTHWPLFPEVCGPIRHNVEVDKCIFQNPVGEGLGQTAGPCMACSVPCQVVR